MNAAAPLGDQYGIRGYPRRRGKLGRKVSMSVMAFFIAVGGVSLIFFWLMVRADRIRDRRGAYADGSSDTSGISSSNDGSLLNWFGGRSWSSDNSCTTSDSSSSGSWSDSSGCSDGGGGGDSGGGGD
jgi:hypothetical protein